MTPGGRTKKRMEEEEEKEMIEEERMNESLRTLFFKTLYFLFEQ